MSTTDIYLHSLMENLLWSFVNPGLWLTVGEDSVQYRKRKKSRFLVAAISFFYR